MGESPKEYYQNTSAYCQIEIKKLKGKAFAFSIARLTVFALAVLLVYYFSHNTQVIIIGLLIAIAIFLFLLSKSTNTKTQLNFWQKKKAILQDEIDFLEGKISQFEDGLAFTDQKHFYAADIDLFGPRSFFQYINRTQIREGKASLAHILAANDINNVLHKQEVITELSQTPEWGINYRAKAALVDQQIKQGVVVDWLNNYVPFINKWLGKGGFVLGIVSAILIVLYALGLTSIYPLAGVFFAGLFITSLVVKQVNKMSVHVSQLKSVFNHYGALIEQIETNEFTSANCVEMKSKLLNQEGTASKLVNEFSGYLNALDQRNNILFAVFGNGLMLWDCQQVYKIEQWISAHKTDVAGWFEAVAWFDAQNSLANYAFNHQNFVFPLIDGEASAVIKATGLGHVFIDEAKRVTNNFELSNESFSIVTGANMAGKSTFLRTVALSLISANAGLPVCAKSYHYRPIKLVTSMRNTDSLQDESSYFFSELSRLKIIVDAVASEPYFVILDEILKGTNSKDKEEGSIKLMNRLANTKASGLIATHDLGLCTIEESLPNVKNQYFDAEIKDGELFFDYTLKEGICQNMNASFLLEKMGIV